MKELNKHVGEETQLMFGVGTDKKLGSSLAVTIITSLSEEPAQIAERAPDQDDPEKKKIALRPEDSDVDDDDSAEEEAEEPSAEEPQQVVEDSEPEPETEAAPGAASRAPVSLVDDKGTATRPEYFRSIQHITAPGIVCQPVGHSQE